MKKSLMIGLLMLTTACGSTRPTPDACDALDCRPDQACDNFSEPAVCVTLGCDMDNQCPFGEHCTFNPSSPTTAKLSFAARDGVCEPDDVCAGFAGIECTDARVCVDDPSDNCDPSNGGADCSGLCRADDCRADGCSDTQTCEQCLSVDGVVYTCIPDGAAC